MLINNYFFLGQLVMALVVVGSLYYYNSSDGPVVRPSAMGAVVDLGLILSRVKPMILKLVFTASQLDAQH